MFCFGVIHGWETESLGSIIAGSRMVRVGEGCGLALGVGRFQQ